MEELTLEQIMLVLAAWIEEGRITVVDGKLFVDNVLAMDQEAENVVEDIVPEYDAWGISIATVGGGVTFRLLDERLALDRASNDPIVVAVATAHAQFYFMHIDRGLDAEGSWNQLNNYNKHSFLSGMFGRKRDIHGVDKGTYMSSAGDYSPDKFVKTDGSGESLPYVISLTPEQHFSKEWKVLNTWYHTLGKLPNYLTYSQGVISGFYGHPKYETEHLSMAGTRAVWYYERAIGVARKKAALINDGSIPPNVGPFIPW